MSSNFPLYDNLSSDVKSNDLTTPQKKKFINNISEMDENGIELIYTLIKFYQNDNNDSVDLIPYNGTYINNNITFDLDAFPTKLKQILYKFTNMHKKKLKDEMKIAKNK